MFRVFCCNKNYLYRSMKTCCLFLLSIIFNFTLQAQKVWKFSDSTFVYVLSLEKMKNDGGTLSDTRSVKQIDIYRKLTNAKIQSIKPEPQIIEPYYDSTIVFIVEDMNFDGRKDFRLLRGATTNLQTSYDYWFYNAAANKFVADTALQYFQNPSFDAVSKTVHTWWRQGFSNFGHALYKWNKNKIVLIAEEEEIHMDVREPDAGEVVTKRNVNGKITTTKRKASKNVIDFMHKGKCRLK